ncbi:MAG: hypothetical protein ACRD2B_12530 [Terriglobia bacterium]
MADNEVLISINERLGMIDKRLGGLEARDLHRWDRDLLAAARKGLLRALVRLEATPEDLQSVGTDPTPGKAVSKFDRRGLYEELRSLPGGGYWHKRFDDAEEDNTDFILPSFYLRPIKRRK